MKVIITGSSDYGDMPRSEIDAALKEAKWEPSMVILTGFTNGVDEVARQWALHVKGIPFLTVPAQYRVEGGEAAAKKQRAQIAKTGDALLIIKRDREGGYTLDRANGIKKFMEVLKKPVHVREV